MRRDNFHAQLTSSRQEFANYIFNCAQYLYNLPLTSLHHLLFLCSLTTKVCPSVRLSRVRSMLKFQKDIHKSLQLLQFSNGFWFENQPFLPFTSNSKVIVFESLSYIFSKRSKNLLPQFCLKYEFTHILYILFRTMWIYLKLCLTNFQLDI